MVRLFLWHWDWHWKRKGEYKVISINYVNSLVIKKRYSSIFFRIIKLLNLLAHLLIVLLLILSYNINNDIVACNNKITKIKSLIEEKRATNNITDKENVWTTYYYRLLAIKELLSKNTNYGVVFTDLGTFFPKDAMILNTYCSGNELKIAFYVDKTTMEKLGSFYDYVNILKTSFEKSTYIKKDDIVVEKVVNADSIDLFKNKSGNILEVKLSVISRR